MNSIVSLFKSCWNLFRLKAWQAITWTVGNSTIRLSRLATTRQYSEWVIGFNWLNKFCNCKHWYSKTMSFCYCSYLPPVFASTPGLAFRLLDLTCVTNWPRMSNLYCQLGQGYSATSSKLCNWLFLMCLVSAINHLHPECWATFG